MVSFLGEKSITSSAEAPGSSSAPLSVKHNTSLKDLPGEPTDSDSFSVSVLVRETVYWYGAFDTVGRITICSPKSTSGKDSLILGLRLEVWMVRKTVSRSTPWASGLKGMFRVCVVMLDGRYCRDSVSVDWGLMRRW